MRSVLTFDEAVPPAPLPPRRLGEEVLVVLALSLLASAVFAAINLVTAPVAGVTVASVSQDVVFARQLASFVFGLAPVWLVLYLVRRDGEGVGAIGMAWNRPRFDIGLGVALAVVIGAAGIGLYLVAVELGVNRFVVPAPPLGHWWTVPVLVLNAVEAGLLEETIVAGYLITRLQQLGVRTPWAIFGSAGLRASYHLYQGWGGFLGNLAMGLLLGWVFARWRRTWPLVIAHVLIDVGAGLGWIVFRDRLPGFGG
ncbi:MAG: type II CAAX endopeptidase family protein [Actinomycetota bacterium]